MNRAHHRICIFGGPTLLRGGEEVSLTPQQACVLAMIFGREESSLAKDKILVTLWPEEEPSRARRRLNQLLYSIRQKVGEPGVFHTLSGEIRRPPSGVSWDLKEFREGLKQRRLDDCASLLRRGFAPKTLGRINRHHTDWIGERTAELRQELRRHADLLWRVSEQEEDWEGARVAAEVLLDLKPTDERSLQKVIEARMKTGRVAEAAAAYGEFLDRRGDADHLPSARTKKMIESVQKVLVSRGGHSDQAAGGTPVPPLLGRDVERRLLHRTLSRHPREELRGILVSGEAGIGKTRLIQEVLYGPALEGHLILSADSAELEQLIPLNPLIELFKGAEVGELLRELDEPWRSVLYGVMPSHFLGDGPIPEAPHIQPGSVPRRLFEAFYQLLLSLVKRGPVVLVLEDLQWADETTISVLDFMVRRWDQGGLQIIMSARKDEIRKHPSLGQFLENLRNHLDSLEIHLSDLEPADTEALINNLAGEPLDLDNITRLRSLAGGNPFFLIELTLEFLAGRLGPVVTPEGIVPIPLSIRQVLDRRLSQLSKEAETVLGVLAVFSRPLDFSDLNSVAHLSVMESLGGLDQLHEFRLVSQLGSEVTISHELVRQSVYQSLPHSRRAWLHGRIAHHLLSRRHPNSPDELAVHFHHAGAKSEARLYAVEAADRAEAAGAIPEALHFLRIAREHAAEPEMVADLVGRMGHLNYLHQNLDEAAPLLELAAQRFRRQGNLARALRSEVERIDCLAKLGRLPLPETLDELDRLKTEARVSARWEVFTKALDVEVHSLDHRGNLEAVRDVLKEARRYSNRGGPNARCRARAVLALNVYYGSPEEGLSAAREAVKIAVATEDVDLQLHALNRLIVVLLYQGKLHSREGIQAFEMALARLTRSGDLILKFFIKLNKAVWHLEVGELEPARIAFKEVVPVIRGTRATDAQAMLLLNEGELELASFDIEAARACYGKAEGYLRPSSPEAFVTIINAGLGLCALSSGDLGEARQREAALPDFPDFWAFDPSVVVAFKATMLKRRGDLVAAEKLFLEVAEDVKGRLVTAWIKLSLGLANLLKSRDPNQAKAIVEEVLEVANSLELTQRRKEALKLLRLLNKKE